MCIGVFEMDLRITELLYQNSCFDYIKITNKIILSIFNRNEMYSCIMCEHSWYQLNRSSETFQQVKHVATVDKGNHIEQKVFVEGNLKLRSHKFVKSYETLLSWGFWRIWHKCQRACVTVYRRTSPMSLILSCQILVILTYIFQMTVIFVIFFVCLLFLHG